MEKGKLRMFLGAITPDNRQKSEAILRKIVSTYLRDKKRTHEINFELQNFNSKDIEKMLTLLENSTSSIRKLAVLMVGLVLTNPLSKIFFLEKCGLSLIVGKFFLSRLKYVFNFSGGQIPATKNIQRLTKLLHAAGNSPPRTLFWYVPLYVRNGRMKEDFRPSLHEFKISDMLDPEGRIDLARVPDPVFNLCGLEFTNSDRQAKLQSQKTTFKFAEPGKKKYAQSVITGGSIRNRISKHTPLSSKLAAHLTQSSIHKKRPKASARHSDAISSSRLNSSNQPSHLYYKSTIAKTSNSKFRSKLQGSFTANRQKKKERISMRPISGQRLSVLGSHQFTMTDSSKLKEKRRMTFNFAPKESKLRSKLKGKNMLGSGVKLDRPQNKKLASGQYSKLLSSLKKS